LGLFQAWHVLTGLFRYSLTRQGTYEVSIQCIFRSSLIML
jgi:hypothetical protein